MSNIFELYKPLRNLLKEVELEDSLYVCWNIANYLAFNKKLPSYFELPPKLKYSDEFLKRRLFLINDWELEFLVSEIICNSPKRIYGRKKSLNSIRVRARAVNYIRSFQDAVYQESFGNREVFLEMNRIAHQQFIWQPADKLAAIYRYYSIFSSSDFEPIVNSSFSLTYDQIIRIGMLLVGYFTVNPSISFQSISKVDFLNKYSMESFLKIFAIGIDKLKDIIKDSRKYNEKLIYTFQPLRRSPIIIESKLFCPIPTLLFWQVTNGIYYHIVNNTKFDNIFGKNFQEYLIKYINKANTKNKIKCLPEVKYGNPEKKTADIILVDEDSILLIECKTKRMIQESKESILDSTAIENDIDKLTKAFVQIYKQVDEYKDNKYPHIKFSNNKKIFVMVITLENWYIGFNQYLFEKLSKNIIKMLTSLGKRESILQDVPYYFFSSEQFENIIQVITEHGIKYFCEKFLNEKGFDAFKDFPFKTVFKSESKKIFQAVDNSVNTLINLDNLKKS